MIACVWKTHPLPTLYSALHSGSHSRQSSKAPEAPGPWQEALPDRAMQALRFALLDKGGVGRQRQPFLPWLSFSRVKVHPVFKLKLSADDSLKILVVALGDPESWLPILREAWRDLGDSNGDLNLSVSSSFSCP